MLGPIKGNKGKGVGMHKNIKDIQACSDLCIKNGKCKSFLYGSNKKCALKDKELTGSEPLVKKNQYWYSVYLTCDVQGSIYKKSI